MILSLPKLTFLAGKQIINQRMLSRYWDKPVCMFCFLCVSYLFFCIKNAMALNKILGPVPQFLYSRCLFADTHDTHLGDHPAAPCEAVDHWERGECTRPGVSARRTLHGGSRLFLSQNTHSRYSSYQKSDSRYGGLNLMVYYSDHLAPYIDGRENGGNKKPPFSDTRLDV